MATPEPSMAFEALRRRRGGGSPPPAGGIPGLPPAGATPGPLEVPPGPGAVPGPGGPGAPGAPPGGDPLASALANVNNQLQGAIDGSIPMTPEAENELKVMIQLVGNLAQKESQKAPGPGAPLPPAGPGTPAAGVPGPGGPPQL